jgi:hypothetical protein
MWPAIKLWIIKIPSSLFFKLRIDIYTISDTPSNHLAIKNWSLAYLGDFRLFLLGDYLPSCLFENKYPQILR